MRELENILHVIHIYILINGHMIDNLKGVIYKCVMNHNHIYSKYGSLISSSKLNSNVLRVLAQIKILVLKILQIHIMLPYDII